MTLTSKFILWAVLLALGVLGLGAASVWNLVDVKRVSDATAAEYQAYDRAEAVVGQVVWLRDELRGENAARFRDRVYFVPIEREVSLMVAQLRVAAASESGDGKAELDHGEAATRHLANAIDLWGDPSKPKRPGDAAAAAAELEKARASLANVTRMVPASIHRQVAGTADRLPSRLTFTSLLLLAVLLLSAAVHFLQYRALVRPLLWLRDNMKRSAAREFKEPVALRGDREFRDVGSLFNNLAGELADLYANLEEKVVVRSRELVRSERLASVGFLAAGVAHEINNPLSVISGYAELAEKALARVMNGGGDGNRLADGSPGESRPDDDRAAEAEAEALANALDAQTIIRDEAFRCKEITTRLLSLARGGNDTRGPLRLDDVARQVAVLVKGLKKYADRRVVVDLGPGDALDVVANPTEMKQVLLNLTVNALEAVVPERGEVRIGGRRAGEWVELWVQDNGKGMTQQTLRDVFEPFFTDRRGAGDPGTGLGLSITHAIVEGHDGRISAASDGPGRGSRFTVRLPAAKRAAKVIAAAEVA
ncbi:MAG TPA: ATP-binding protein [Humisphaera sp.]